MRVQTILLLAAAVVLGACGSDDTTGPGEGASATFAATVGAPVTRAFDGAAAFAVDNTDPEIGFALGLVEPGAAGDDMIVFHRALAGQLGGTNTIGDGSAENVPAATLIGTVILDANTDDPLLCLSTEGTLTTSTASASRLKGAFTMQVDCVRMVSFEEFVDVTVTGTFDAAGGTVIMPD